MSAVSPATARPLDRLRRNASDLVGLFVLPMVAAALPWSLGYRLLGRLARRSAVFRPEADAAWLVARRYLPAAEEHAWKRRYRLLRWVERADTYLTLSRSARWWQRRIDVEGQWPSPDGAILFLTFHWGAGHWVWKSLRAHGVPAYFLARRPVVGDLGVSRVALWYGSLRAWAFSRIGSLGPLYTGGSSARIRAALGAGENVVGMLDLPAGSAQRPLDVELFGRPARLPSRLAQIARSEAARVAVFSCGFDFATGRRRLRIEALPAQLDEASLLQRYADHLSACLLSAPECWMMWHEAPAIFRAEDADAADA
jgi:hypothetical protein